MFKIIGLLKKKAGMSSDEFRHYYETTHRQLGEKYLRNFAIKYMRRYLTPFPNPLTGQTPETEHDVVLEIWYPDRATFEAAHAQFADEDILAEISADEEKLFDRSAMLFYFVDECESPLA
jgi:hypothetical protein